MSNISHNLDTPYSGPSLEILRLLRAKAQDAEFEQPFTEIESTAMSLGVPNPLLPSTDAYVTAISFLGSKSLSHVLSHIERCKERLLSIGTRSEPARRQIITSAMDYWHEKPGVGVNIVDKLLNYAILTPVSIVTWALGDQLKKGEGLIQSHVFEMVSSTITKVTKRVRQIVEARNQADLPADQVALLHETLVKERSEMQKLFGVVEDALVGVAEGSVDEMAESRDQDGRAETILQGWGGRWLRVFRRKMAVEEAWFQEMMNQPQVTAGDAMEDVNGSGANGNQGELDEIL